MFINSIVLYYFTDPFGVSEANLMFGSCMHDNEWKYLLTKWMLFFPKKFQQSQQLDSVLLSLFLLMRIFTVELTFSIVSLW